MLAGEQLDELSFTVTPMDPQVYTGCCAVNAAMKDISCTHYKQCKKTKANNRVDV